MQVPKKKIGSWLAMLICLSHAGAQTNYIDTLQKLLQNSKHDSDRIKWSYELSSQLNSYDISRAQQYLESGYALAKRSGDKYHTAYYFKEKAELLWDLARYDSATRYFDSAIALYDELVNGMDSEAKKQDCIFGKTDCLIGKGLVAAKLSNYHESTQYYMDAIAGIENIPGTKKNDLMATLYADIASNYYELEQFEASLATDKKLLPYLDKVENVDMYVIGNLFVADDFSSLSQFDSSSAYLAKVEQLVLTLNKPTLNIRYYYTLGTIQRKRKQWTEALHSYQKANEAALKLNDDFQVMNSMEGMAACYLQMGNLVKAKGLALTTLAEAKRLNVPLMGVQALQVLTEVEEHAGNFAAAYAYQQQFILANDSLKKEKMQKQMHEIETRYQGEKKAKEILQLQKSNALQTLSLQKKSTFNYFLIGSVAALLITGFLGYRNIRHRQQLARQQDEMQKQRIKELEVDKHLIAVDSMLKGQEDERSRLAKDLHDGLGGLLSGVKYSLSNMKQNLIMTPDNMVVFERSLDMLDTSIKELRRVAHNMMPEMLTRFGLDESIKEYCNTVNATKLINLKYQSLGMESRLDNSQEIIIYRIVQELVNNILKHAAASEAFIQLIRQNDRLSIVVEDNGKGFDTATLETSNGAGWVNIRSRVDYLKGQLDIHSEPGKGTLVNMEFNV